jgi:prevent-host-death family protein
MNSVSIYDAKTGFSSLVDKVQKGSFFIITKRGEPVAKLCPVEPADTRRPLGVMSLPDLPDSFFEPLPDDELELWGGQA